MSDLERSEQMEADWKSLWWGFLSELMQEFGLVGAKKGDLTKLNSEDLADRLESLDKLHALINLQKAILGLFCGKVTSQNILIIGSFFREINSKVALPKFLKEFDEFSEKYSKKP
ncbi:MAG: hypothetical protein HYT36_04075 [Candidatus Staskawiczbacteria bacterium]|nr:hypothetical protein [Candidatus Staskawiczbacteria bacterium]